MLREKKLTNWWLMTIILMVLAGSAPGQIFVDDSATGANNGTSWADAYVYLQDALVATSSGEIWVAKGTYKPDAGDGQLLGNRYATFQLKNGVTIYGGFAGNEDPLTFDLADRNFAMNQTILSGDLDENDLEIIDPLDLLDDPTRANNSFHVVTGSGTDETAILDGFTITSGYANSGSMYIHGGGMFIYNESSPTLINLTFTKNYAENYGGGMYIFNTDPEPHTFKTPTLTNCTFFKNSAKYRGGGICTNSNGGATLNKCQFIQNYSKLNGGGGMYNYAIRTSLLTLNSCIFRGNFTEVAGGGMFNKMSHPVLINCIFNHNTANHGGGLRNTSSNATLTNCTFSQNSVNTHGGGIDNFECFPVITNCILWGNTVAAPIDDESAQIYYNTANPNVYANINYCCIQGWTGTIDIDGIGNIAFDPLFVDADGPDNIIGTKDDDLRLSENSPCIDAGNNDVDINGSTPEIDPLPDTDLSGNPRFFDYMYPDTGFGIPPIVDMGAYEFYIQILFVDKIAIGANDGSNWADAYVYLQDALAAATNDYQIWV
ncbi:MAG: right-handed parallel beta-helix repeat-containing protein, partial [Planctomycetes bacterium]|nr:right-handed parallel beta-helix repeat-containing protein [Planctomycetota bacterium]